MMDEIPTLKDLHLEEDISTDVRYTGDAILITELETACKNGD